MLEKILEKMGLSEKEAKVYVAALELGQATVQQIALKANVVRPTAYVILEKLMGSGLVSSLAVGKKTMFVAEDPHELKNILDEQAHVLETRRRELDEAMNQFTAIYNAQKGKPIVRYFEGAEGLETLDKYGTDKTLASRQELLTIIPIDILEKTFPSRRTTALEARIKAGIQSRAIYTREDGPLDDSSHTRELRKAIYLPNELLPITMTISIYAWGVKLFNLDPEKPYGVLIEDPVIAKNMKVMYELAWLGAKQLADQAKR